MNSAVRGGATLMILMLAVFPCGAALTVLGRLVVDALRYYRADGEFSPRLIALWVPILWAGGGVLGFLSLIPGVDILMVAERRLRWYSLFGILLGILAAGFFAVTYAMHLASAAILRVICVAPVAITLILLVSHLIRFSFSRAHAGATTVVSSHVASDDGEHISE